MGGMVSRPDIRGSAGAGFGTGICTAPFRLHPGICRCKARPSHTQCFLRLHPGSLAPMRQRPGLRFPIPHLESFPPHIRASAGAGFGTGLCAIPFRPRPGIRRYKARPSHAQCFLRLYPGSLAPMRQRPSLRFPIPHLENFPPHIRDLPVWASARAFMRPRFAGVRASADVRPALPILNVSCACIRAALPPCGSAPA